MPLPPPILARHLREHGYPSVVQKPKPGFSVTAQAALSQLANTLAAADPVRDRLGATIQIFCVGGAVRDAILGISNVDHDFVVVGATVDDMLAAGFTPVGQDFPVFLHPVTHDEYALARTERKSGKGYKGFVFNAAPSVTLTEDLSRRDLTMNAIAINQDGDLIDPFHGVDDLQAGILRHIGPAFSEDPVRLLRIARFASRWPSFRVAPETLGLCKQMVCAGETRALVAERVWQELQKGLMGEQPSRMLAVLTESGAWFDLHAQIQAPQAATMVALDQAALAQCSLEVRYALLVLNHGAHQPADFFKAPRHCLDLASLAMMQSATAATVVAALTQSNTAAIDTLFNWLMQADVVRKQDRLSEVLDVLIYAGYFTRPQADDLLALATLLCSEQATNAVANAAKTATQGGQSIARATRMARRDVFAGHPRFLIK